MTAGSILKEVMNSKGFSFRTLAAKLGYSVGSYISERVRRDNGMRVDSLLEMLEAMDCEVIIKNKIGKKEQWVLTREAPKE